MPNLATWMRPKDEKWFRPFFAKHPELHVFDARNGDVSMDQMDGLLLTGGSDITPEFLRQENVDPNLIDKEDLDPRRDGWEFDAISKALKRGLPILAICRGIQVLNVALGGTLKLDIPGHRFPNKKSRTFNHCMTARRRPIRKCKQFTSSGDRSARRRRKSKLVRR